MNNMVLFGMFFYIFVMLVIGYWSSKRIKNLTDFLFSKNEIAERVFVRVPVFIEGYSDFRKRNVIETGR